MLSFNAQKVAQELARTSQFSKLILLMNEGFKITNSFIEYLVINNLSNSILCVLSVDPQLTNNILDVCVKIHNIPMIGMLFFSYRNFINYDIFLCSCIKHVNMTVLKSHLLLNKNIDKYMIQKASVLSNDHDLLVYINSLFKFTKEHALLSLEKSLFNSFKYFYNNALIDSSMFESVNNIEIANFLLEGGETLDYKVSYSAVKNNNKELIRWCLENDILFDKRSLLHTVKSCDLESFTILRDQVQIDGCIDHLPLDHQLSYQMMEKILEREDINVNLLKKSIEAKNIRCIKYIVEREDYTHVPNVLDKAINTKNIFIVSYLYNRGYRVWNEDIITEDYDMNVFILNYVDKRNEELLQFFKKNLTKYDLVKPEFKVLQKLKFVF